jgi:hypothetical protein
VNCYPLSASSYRDSTVYTYFTVDLSVYNFEKLSMQKYLYLIMYKRTSSMCYTLNLKLMGDDKVRQEKI